MAASTMASREVGTCTKGIPRSQVAAAKSGHVANHAAPQRHHGRLSLQAKFQGGGVNFLDGAQGFVAFPGGQQQMANGVAALL